MSGAADVDAIFFDFDGVIVDTVALKERAFRQIILEHAPQHVEPIMQFYWAHGGVSRLEKFRRIWQEILHRPIDDAHIAALGSEFARRVYDLVVSCDFVKGAFPFLCEFHARWPCYVISGTPQPELRSLVTARKLDRYFRGVFGSPPGKVEIGERILTAHGYDRRRVWFVGDATTDRDAAHALGIRFVGLAGPHLCPFLNGNETLVEDLSELAGVLMRA